MASASWLRATCTASPSPPEYQSHQRSLTHFADAPLPLPRPAPPRRCAAYERSCPVFNGKCVADGEAARYFTSGDGGASLYTKWIAQPAWSEVRIAEWGHGEVTFFNNTWAQWNWVRNADQEPDAYDSVYIKNVGL